MLPAVVPFVVDDTLPIAPPVKKRPRTGDNTRPKEPSVDYNGIPELLWSGSTDVVVQESDKSSASSLNTSCPQGRAKALVDMISRSRVFDHRSD